MKRLTEEHWRNLDPWECCGQDRFCGRRSDELGGCKNGCIVPKLYARLAAYEDAGLTPEEIEKAKDGVDLKFALWISKAWGLADGRLHEILTAEKDGRLVVLPDVKERDRKSFVDGLQDYFREASFCDRSVGIFGMSEGEKELAFALMTALTREEAETALKKREADNEAD